MAADKRNAFVIVALVAAMTLGGRLLLWLEPGKPRWQADASLVAARQTPVEAVTIALVDRAGANARLEAGGDESVCVVYPDDVPRFAEAGARVLVLVVADEPDSLPVPQKQYLLGALGSLLQRGRAVPVRLEAGSDPAVVPDVPAAARELRDLLVRKELLSQS